MHDPRIDQLSKQLVGYSTEVKEGDGVLIELFDAPPEVGVSLIREVREAGGIPYINMTSLMLAREMQMGATEKQFETIADNGIYQMKKLDCYIAVRGGMNVNEFADVPVEKRQMVAEKTRPLQNERVNNTRWCVLRWPTPAMAQSAGMSTEAFEDFYFRVCLFDYSTLKDGMAALEKRMREADKVHISGAETDLKFSLKDIPAMACGGDKNLPDGECFSAPVKDSVQGYITYNAPSIYHGTSFDNVRLEFKDGKIIQATANNTQAINDILDTDDGARYIGEFALAFNPEIMEPMRDILFDEKIAGSFHFTPGQAYKEFADNSNRSAIHWDLVNIQRPEYGGGEIYFDGELIRKDGQFVADDLLSLNY